MRKAPGTIGLGELLVRMGGKLDSLKVIADFSVHLNPAALLYLNDFFFF